MKLIDCFMYFDEDLILDIRLNTLDEKVDKFIIVEATKNHAGKDKRLNFNIENFSILIAFLGAITTSLAYLTVKELSKKENIFIIIKYFPLISTITLLPLVYQNWITPNFNEFIWILGIGIFTQGGQTFLTLGLKNLPASQASSINYLQVLFGSVLGILLFEEKININFIIGSVFVLLGTIISTSKNQKTDLELNKYLK